MTSAIILARRTRAIPVQYVLVALWLALVSGGLIWHLRAWGYDDPHITYRYAANISAGRGFVYNDGERVLATTTPLYALALAAAHRLTGADLPLIGNLLSCLSMAGGGLALWLLGERWQTPVAGAIGLVLYPTFVLLVRTAGAEMAFYNLLVLLGLTAYAYDAAPEWSILAIAGAVLTRYDGVIAAGALWLFDLTGRRRLTWRALLIGGTLLAAWGIWSTLYFGSPIPATLLAKQHQGMMAASVNFPARGLELARHYAGAAWFRGHLPLLLIGAGALALRRSPWRILLAWNALYALSYSALGISGYFWYYAPLVTGLIALIGLGGEAIYRSLAWLAGKRALRNGGALAAGVVALAVLWAALSQIGAVAALPADPRLADYRAAGAWLSANTPKDATVAALEVGVIGFYAERPMLDFAGLIQPIVARRLGANTSYDDAAVWSINRFQPDYVVLVEGHLPQANALARARCAAQTAFGKVNIYRCR